MGHCAAKQNKFWEVNDYLFANGRRKEQITIDELCNLFALDSAKMQNCINSYDTHQAILNDINAGKALNIYGTPTYVIDNKTYPGYIPPDIFEILNNP